MSYSNILKKKILAIWSIFSLFFNMAQPAILALTFVPSVYAEEELLSPQPTTSPIESASPSAQPVEIVTSLVESITPSADPSAEPSVSPDPTPYATSEPLASVEPSIVPTPTLSETPSSPVPSHDSSPSPSPSLDSDSSHNEQLSISIINHIIPESIQEFDLTITETGSASLATDKPDYAPTDTAVITGSGFLANTTYSLTISSTDEPATSTTVNLVSDKDGHILYSYQLDGTYRPNYQVEAFLGSTLVATVSFTDSQTINSLSLNGANAVSVGPSVSITASVSVSLTSQGTSDWKSTGWKIGSGSETCINTTDHTATNSFTENFTVTSPAISGIHDFTTTIYANESCTGAHTSQILADAITVSVPVGTIQIIKDVSPDDNTKWNFVISGSTANNISNLGDGESSSIFTSNTGSYTITESGARLSDYTTTYSCNDGTTGSGVTASVTLSSSQNLICTFTNTLTPVVYVDICHATHSATNPFERLSVPLSSIDTLGNGNADHNRSDHQDGEDIIPPGEGYPERNWDQTGQDIWHNNCQVKSDLTVIKEVVGGTLTPDDFNIHVASASGEVLGSPARGSSTGTIYTLNPGTYTISEDDPTPMDYEQTSITCDGKLTSDVRLVSGTNSTCTIVNTYVPPVVTTSDVTICKQDTYGTGLSGWRIALLGSVLGSYTVPVDGSTLNSLALPLGNYVVKGSGTYKYSTGESWIADSKFSLRVPGQSYSYHSNPWNTWVSGDELTGYEGALELQLNASNVAWGPFNPEHNYYYPITSGPVGFSIWDNYYGDNSNLAINPLTATIYNGYTGSTGEDGCITFADVPIGDYEIEESQQEGWSNLSGLGAVVVDQSAQSFTIINAQDGEPLPGSIAGFKYEDLDGELTTTDDREAVVDWSIDLYSCDASFTTCSADPIKSTTTASDGSYTFTGLDVGYYKVVERSVTGWINLWPTSINLTIGAGQDLTEQDFLNSNSDKITICHATASERNLYNQITLPKVAVVKTHLTHQGVEDITPEFEYEGVTYPSQGGGQAVIDNDCQDLPPVLRIQKSNNAVGSKNPGDLVTFTLTLDLADNALDDVVVTDVTPDGFDYVSGSWSATKNGNPFTIAEPNYASPGTWNLGSLNPDDQVILTYQASISNDQDSGTYNDLAWATGASQPWGNILALGHDSAYVDDIFVGTSIEVSKSTQQTGSVNIEREAGEVLGASIELPSTGTNTLWLIIAFAFLISGIVLIFGQKPSKKLSILLLPFSCIFFSASSVQAASSTLSVRIEQPASPTRLNEWKLSYAVLDRLGRTPSVSCFVKKPGSNLFVQFDNPKISSKTSGDNGHCQIGDSLMSSQGDYQFKVTATSGNDSKDSDVVVVTYDSDGPGTPTSYVKEHPSLCRWIVKFHTANDGGLTSKVEVYSSDQKNFDTNSHTRVGTVSLGSDQDGSFTHDRAEGCDKDWYYVIRAFDSVGNQSSHVGDSIVKLISTTTPQQTTLPAQTVTTGSGSVLGTINADNQSDQIVDDSASQNVEIVDSEGVVAGANDTLKSFVSNQTIWWILAILATMITIYAVYRRRTSHL